MSSVVLFDGTVELPVDGERTGDLSSLIDNPNGLPISFAPVTPPENGEVMIEPSGTFSYLPFIGFGGVDAFTFSVIVNGGQPAIARVTAAVSIDCSDGTLVEPQAGTPVAIDGVANAQIDLRPCATLARTGPGQIVAGGGEEPVDPAPVEPGSGSGDGGSGSGGTGSGDGSSEAGAVPGGGSAVELPNTGVGTGQSGQSSALLATVILAIAAGLVIAALVRRRLI